MTTTTTATLREQAEDAVRSEVQNAERYSHMRNYHRLHVRRDGSVSWFESINKSDNLIDSGADHFAAIPSVHVTGTGSYGCDCDYCNEVHYEGAEQLAAEQGREYDRSSKYDSQEDAIEDAVSNGDLSGIEDEMLRKFAEIPAGYFDDEDEDPEQIKYEIRIANQYGGWDADAVGNTDNEFATEEEAYVEIEQLKELGEEWRTAVYQVVPISN